MIVLEFSENDSELQNALSSAFGGQIDFNKTKSFDGSALEVVHVVLPVVAALTPILVAYFARPKSPPTNKRLVLSNGGEFTLEGYSADEVERFLEKIGSKTSG